ncbi:hypothetical protein, partial [Clostridium tertium]|uniref:hypothetical protein n=1 Tax=Clostridium tertium TaxID=1559 RepID=UPI00325B268F
MITYVNIAEVPNKIAKSIKANLLSFFMIAITRVIILTIILVKAKIILVNNPVKSIVSNRYKPVIINR